VLLGGGSKGVVIVIVIAMAQVVGVIDESLSDGGGRCLGVECVFFSSCAYDIQCDLLAD
jgi:hypothetical protein